MAKDAVKKIDLEFQLEEVKEVVDQSAFIDGDVAEIPNIDGPASSNDDDFELEVTARPNKEQESKKVENIEKNISPVFELADEDLAEASRINEDEKLQDLPDLTELAAGQNNEASKGAEDVALEVEAQSADEFDLELSNEDEGPITQEGKPKTQLTSLSDLSEEEEEEFEDVASSEAKEEIKKEVEVQFDNGAELEIDVPEELTVDLSGNEGVQESASEVEVAESIEDDLEESADGVTTILKLPQKMPAQVQEISSNSSKTDSKINIGAQDLAALVEDQENENFDLEEQTEEFRANTTVTQEEKEEKTRKVTINISKEELEEEQLVSKEEIAPVEISEQELSAEEMQEEMQEEVQEEVQEEIQEEAPRDIQTAPKTIQKNIPKEKVKSKILENVRFEYDENEMLKLQATIRHLRDEREGALKDFEKSQDQIRNLERDKLTYKAELDELKIENSILKKRHADQMREVHAEMGVASDKKSIYESKIRQYQLEIMKLNEKVRVDVNKVRNKEKDLESRLEILTMDSASQIQARDQKIMELKRRIDSMEFSMESALNNEKKAKVDKNILDEKLTKVLLSLKNSLRNIEDDVTLNNLNTDQPISKSERPISRMKKA